jgi:hypothetical protein
LPHIVWHLPQHGRRVIFRTQSLNNKNRVNLIVRYKLQQKLWLLDLATFIIALIVGILYERIGAEILLLTSIASGLSSFFILIVIAYKMISNIFKS